MTSDLLFCPSWHVSDKKWPPSCLPRVRIGRRAKAAFVPCALRSSGTTRAISASKQSRVGVAQRLQMVEQERTRAPAPAWFWLAWQRHLAGDRERPHAARRGGSRLAATDEHAIVARHHRALARTVDVAETACIQFEVQLARFARLQADPGEVDQCAPGRQRPVGVFQIDLHYFVARARAGVAHPGAYAQRVAGLQRRYGKARLLVGELRIGQAVAERIQRFAG